MQVKWISSKAIKGIRRHSQHLAGANLLGDVSDQGTLRLLSADLDDFGTQRAFRPRMWLAERNRNTSLRRTATERLPCARPPSSVHPAAVYDSEHHGPHRGFRRSIAPYR